MLCFFVISFMKLLIRLQVCVTVNLYQGYEDTIHLFSRILLLQNLLTFDWWTAWRQKFHLSYRLCSRCLLQILRDSYSLVFDVVSVFFRQFHAWHIFPIVTLTGHSIFESAEAGTSSCRPWNTADMPLILLLRFVILPLRSMLTEVAQTLSLQINPCITPRLMVPKLLASVYAQFMPPSMWRIRQAYDELIYYKTRDHFFKLFWTSALRVAEVLVNSLSILVVELNFGKDPEYPAWLAGGNRSRTARYLLNPLVVKCSSTTEFPTRLTL